MQELAVSQLLEAYQEVRPTEVATLRSILKQVVPTKRSSSRDALPAHQLYGLLTPDRRRWCEAVAARLPAGPSYQKAYVRFVARLLAFGEAEGLLKPEHFSISPEWRLLLPLIEVAFNDNMSLAHRSALRSALKRLARWATEQGILPTAIPEADKDGVMLRFKSTFLPERDGDFFRARRAWNLLAASKPDLGLDQWPAAAASAFAALPLARWPPMMKRGLDLVLGQEGLASWSVDTRAGYVQRIGSYLGTLERAGIDVAGLAAVAATPPDLFRLLFQGLPAGSGIADAEALVARASADGELLAQLRLQDGRYEGRASEANPLVLLVASAMAEAGHVTSARDLLHKVRAINHALLGITPRHTAWCARRLAILDERARKTPSRYARKKRAVFREPELWLDLVRAREVIQADVARAEEAYRAAVGTHQVILKRRWAIASRNAIVYGLLLCYPIRTRNLVEMRIGEHYDPVRHLLFFPPEETKNGKEIEYELPEGGPFGDLRGLVERYIKEGRPALLAGRPSTYMLVPDPRGGTRLRTRAINIILIELSRRYLQDILPPGIPALNPHLTRHLVASYVIRVHRDVNLAAQLLNDSPATITKAYADVLENKKEATKRFHSDFTMPSRGGA